MAAVTEEVFRRELLIDGGPARLVLQKLPGHKPEMFTVQREGAAKQTLNEVSPAQGYWLSQRMLELRDHMNPNEENAR